ncbi:MAG: hypothetical protein ACK5KU_09685 [Beutenbergiaceae bacterium]
MSDNGPMVGERRRRREAERAVQQPAAAPAPELATGPSETLTRRELRARELATSGVNDTTLEREAVKPQTPAQPAPTSQLETSAKPATTGEMQLTRRELREREQREAATAQGVPSPSAAPAVPAPTPPTPHHGVNAAMAQVHGWPEPAPTRHRVVFPPQTTGPVTIPDNQSTTLLPPIPASNPATSQERPPAPQDASAQRRSPAERAAAPAPAPTPDVASTQVVPEPLPSEDSSEPGQEPKSMKSLLAGADPAPAPFGQQPAWEQFPSPPIDQHQGLALGPEPVSAPQPLAQPPAAAAEEHHMPRWLTALMVVVLVIIMVVLGLLVYRIVWGADVAQTFLMPAIESLVT